MPAQQPAQTDFAVFSALDGGLSKVIAKPIALVEWPNYSDARVLVADDSAINREVAIEA